MFYTRGQVPFVTFGPIFGKKYVFTRISIARVASELQMREMREMRAMSCTRRNSTLHIRICDSHQRFASRPTLLSWKMILPRRHNFERRAPLGLTGFGYCRFTLAYPHLREVQLDREARGQLSSIYRSHSGCYWPRGFAYNYVLIRK